MVILSSLSNESRHKIGNVSKCDVDALKAQVIADFEVHQKQGFRLESGTQRSFREKNDLDTSSKAVPVGQSFHEWRKDNCASA